METRRAVAFETLRRNKSKEGALICKIKSGCKYAIDCVCHYTYFFPIIALAPSNYFVYYIFVAKAQKKTIYVRKDDL